MRGARSTSGPRWPATSAGSGSSLVGPGPAGRSRLRRLREDLTRPGGGRRRRRQFSSESNGEALTTVPANQQLDGYFRLQPGQPADPAHLVPRRLSRPTNRSSPSSTSLLPSLVFSGDGTGTARRVTTPAPTSRRRGGTGHRQRHLLQAQYTDRLVGLVLDRFQATGENYDDAVVVVASDHGASFEPGRSVRSIEDRSNPRRHRRRPTADQGPGQERGRRRPQRAHRRRGAHGGALLGTEPTWDVDGVTLTDDPAIDERGDDRTCTLHRRLHLRLPRHRGVRRPRAVPGDAPTSSTR